MAIQIDAPERMVRPRGTALTSYLPLDTGPFERYPNRWTEGVTFVPTGCDAAIQTVSTNPCAASTVETAAQGFDAAVTFPAFAAKVGLQCSTLWMTAAELHKQLDILLESELSPIFAEQVMQGRWNAAAPTLVKEADDVSQTGQVLPHQAFGAVEDGLADRWRGSVGMIHMPPSIFVQVVDMLSFEDGRFYSPTGHIVVADAGYQAGSPGSGVFTSGVAWIYGSSCVHYRYLAPDWHGYDFENLNFTHNDQIVRAEVVGVAVFEPCSVICAKVDYP